MTAALAELRDDVADIGELRVDRMFDAADLVPLGCGQFQHVVAGREGRQQLAQTTDRAGGHQDLVGSAQQPAGPGQVSGELDAEIA
jgi:hypothetical protein